MISILKIIFYSAFILLACRGMAQDKPEYAFSQIEASLIKNADAVIRREVSTYIIESPKKYVHQVTRVVTVFDKDSRHTAVIVPYDKYSKAELLYVNLYDTAGKFVRRIKKSEIEDRAAYDGISIANDIRLRGVSSYGGQLPFTVEYKWEITYDHTMYYRDWRPLQKRESIETGTFILDTPADLIIHTKTLNHDFDYKKEIRNGRLIQTWVLLNKKAIKQEVSGPPDHGLLPILLISPSVFQVENYTGSMSDWRSYGAFLYEINKGRENMPPVMVSRIQEMTKNCTTTFEKIDTLYHWLQKNMRYVSVQLGIGGFQSFDAAYVEKNRYGDCKALSTFMKGMLKEAGIESYQVIIKWDEEENLFMDDFMSIDFNHMMLHIPQENMWLECTSNYLPTGVIDKDEENKKVLLITPEGGKIATTPGSSALNNKHSTDTILYDQPVILKGRKLFSGNTQGGVLNTLHNSSVEEQKKSFLEYLPLSVQKLHKFQMFMDKSGTKSGYEYQASLNQYGSISGDRFFIPVKTLHLSEFSCTSGSERETAYYSNDDLSETNEIYIRIPEGYAIEYIPPKFDLAFNENSYSIEIKVENGFIYIQHATVRKPLRLEAKEYKELCAYQAAVMKANSQMIVLKKSKT